VPEQAEQRLQTQLRCVNTNFEPLQAFLRSVGLLNSLCCDLKTPCHLTGCAAWGKNPMVETRFYHAESTLIVLKKVQPARRDSTACTWSSCVWHSTALHQQHCSVVMTTAAAAAEPGQMNGLKEAGQQLHLQPSTFTAAACAALPAASEKQALLRGLEGPASQTHHHCLHLVIVCLAQHCTAPTALQRCHDHSSSSSSRARADERF
jgi:hypothetical protein